MKKKFVLLLILLTSACAKDVYMLTNGKPINDQDSYKSTLLDCKFKAIHEYNDNPAYEDWRTRDSLGGLAVFGAAGGAVAGAYRNPDDGTHPLNILTEKCMLQNGYKGTSR